MTALLQGFQDDLKNKEVELRNKTAELHQKDLKIQALTLELGHLRRIRYGKKQEALSSLQHDLFEEHVLEDIGAATEEVEQLTPSVQKPKRRRAGRQPLPDHLPRIVHYHEPSTCECGQCGRDRVKIREDVTEQLDVEPARFFVHRHIRPQYACKHCETMTAAAIPPAVIDGGMAAAGLGLGVDQQISGSSPFIPAGTNRSASSGHTLSFDPGRMGRKNQRGTGTFG